MIFNLCVEGATVKVVDNDLDFTETPVLDRPFMKVNHNSFFIDVKNIARYWVHDGEKVFIKPYDGIDDDSVDVFLQGTVLSALLHQRSMMPLHGNSFEYEGKGVMICGNSGSGKSSVSAAFCRNGAKLISDDLSPLRIEGKDAIVVPLKGKVKLWNDTLKKLNIENNGFARIRPAFEKYYIPDFQLFNAEKKLDHIFILSTHNTDEFIVEELSGIAKYNVLRKQIYRRIYLKGMPKTEKEYFRKLLSVASGCKVTTIVRPQICDIYSAMDVVKKELAK